MTSTRGPRAGSIASRVEACIREHGNMRYQDIAEEIGEHPTSVRTALHRHHGSLFRRAAWRRPAGKYVQPQPLWGLGFMPDTPKPGPLEHVDVVRSYRARRKLRVSSVFALRPSAVAMIGGLA